VQRKESCALLDQIRTIDKRRVHKLFGKITGEELAAVDEGLRLLLGLRDLG
jgi:mRNA-degrading endonuclease toxin of MazEF toxin-antitoxin module